MTYNCPVSHWGAPVAPVGYRYIISCLDNYQGTNVSINTLFGLLGIDMEGEVVALKPGQTTEQLAAERGYKPHGARCSCGEQHEYIAPNGERVFLMDANASEGDLDEKRAAFAKPKEPGFADIKSMLDAQAKKAADAQAKQDAEGTPGGRSSREMLQEKALAAIQRRKEVSLRIVAVLDALHRSVATPLDERGIAEALYEATLYAELQELRGQL